MYLINDQQPGPLIDVNEGDDLEVFVKNDLPVENTIHWHGKYPDVLSYDNVVFPKAHSFVRKLILTASYQAFFSVEPLIWMESLE